MSTAPPAGTPLAAGSCRPTSMRANNNPARGLAACRAGSTYASSPATDAVLSSRLTVRRRAIARRPTADGPTRLVLSCGHREAAPPFGVIVQKVSRTRGPLPRDQTFMVRGEPGLMRIASPRSGRRNLLDARWASVLAPRRSPSPSLGGRDARPTGVGLATSKDGTPALTGIRALRATRRPARAAVASLPLCSSASPLLWSSATVTVPVVSLPVCW